jgi:hypothetical protein
MTKAEEHDRVCWGLGDWAMVFFVFVPITIVPLVHMILMCISFGCSCACRKKCCKSGANNNMVLSITSVLTCITVILVVVDVANYSGKLLDVLVHMILMCISFGCSCACLKCCKSGANNNMVLSITTVLTCITVILVIVDVANNSGDLLDVTGTDYCTWHETSSSCEFDGMGYCPTLLIRRPYIIIDPEAEHTCEATRKLNCTSTKIDVDTYVEAPEYAVPTAIAWICVLLAAIPFRIQALKHADGEHRLSHATDAEFRAAIDCAIEKEDYETAAKLKREQSALAKVTDALHAALAARDYETAGKMQRRKAAMLPTK